MSGVDHLAARNERTSGAARGVNAMKAFKVEEHPAVVKRVAREQGARFRFNKRNQPFGMAWRVHDRDAAAPHGR